jgi:hypothetical protein
MARPVIDERPVEREELCPVAPQPDSTKQTVPQFSLRGLLGLFGAITVCLSVAINGAKLGTERGAVLVVLAVILLWLILCATYRRLGIRIVLIVHCAGPGLLLLVSLMGLFAGPAWPFIMASLVCLGCLLGCLLSPPTLVVTMLVLAWRNSRNRSERRARRHKSQ